MKRSTLTPRKKTNLYNTYTIRDAKTKQVIIDGARFSVFRSVCAYNKIRNIRKAVQMGFYCTEDFNLFEVKVNES